MESFDQQGHFLLKCVWLRIPERNESLNTVGQRPQRIVDSFASSCVGERVELVLEPQAGSLTFLILAFLDCKMDIKTPSLLGCRNGMASKPAWSRCADNGGNCFCPYCCITFGYFEAQLCPPVPN